jgi:hypothetical protein
MAAAGVTIAWIDDGVGTNRTGVLQAPPREWEPVFNALVTDCGLPMTIREGFGGARVHADARDFGSGEAISTK